MGIHSGAHLALPNIRHTMILRVSTHSHSMRIVCLSLVWMFNLTGLTLGSICIPSVLLQCSSKGDIHTEKVSSCLCRVTG